MAKRRYRRRARRLRRFRRSRRSSFRRRYSRSRRSFRRWRRRGRYYYRRKGFYQRRGYKLAISRFKATGSFTRTYKFYCNPFLILNQSGQTVTFNWDGQGVPPDTTDTYGPANYSNYNWASISQLALYSNPSAAAAFTGPCNMYGVIDLPVDICRALGYQAYTVINLSQMGFFWLLWTFEYINQRELLEDDCEKYGYYRALSVSVKFVPRYASVPGKVASMVPTGYTYTLPNYRTTVSSHVINMIPNDKVHNVFGQWSGASAGATTGEWVVNSNPTAVPPPIGDIQLPSYSFSAPTVTSEPVAGSVTVTSTGARASSDWDDDALTLIGYLIPGGPDLDDGKTQANFPGWSASTFGRVVNQPDIHWFTAFRKAGYPRSYISKNKPTTFKFVLPQGGVGAQINTPDLFSQVRNMYGYWKTSGDNARTPFTGHKECIKPGLMTAEMQEIEPLLVDGTQQTRTMKYWKYFNPANCNLFIPGVRPQQLLNRYKVSFSYKVQYYSRVYDMN